MAKKVYCWCVKLKQFMHEIAKKIKTTDKGVHYCLEERGQTGYNQVAKKEQEDKCIRV